MAEALILATDALLALAIVAIVWHSRAAERKLAERMARLAPHLRQIIEVREVRDLSLEYLLHLLAFSVARELEGRIRTPKAEEGEERGERGEEVGREGLVDVVIVSGRRRVVVHVAAPRK